ncbi:MAG TPA: peptidylprolyl isomerase [Desulfuromonadales bacterium]|nr:peptidylprolyl isomerase [Desulfuromonadales bacterium]
MIRAAENDTVKVHYSGELADGTVFDRSPDERPLTFIIGKQEVIPGFEEAVVGMYMGEAKTVVVPPEKAYGAAKQELIDTVNREELPADLQLAEGVQLEVTREDDSKLLLMVRQVTDDQVTLDANHPLAGRDLTFKIKLLEVRKAEAGPTHLQG